MRSRPFRLVSFRPDAVAAAVKLSGIFSPVVSRSSASREVEVGPLGMFQLALKRGGARYGAESAALERLLPEEFGEPGFEFADVLGEPPVLLVQVGVLTCAKPSTATGPAWSRSAAIRTPGL